MKQQRCGLRITNGVASSSSVQELIEQEAKKMPPMFAWAEPDPIQAAIAIPSGRHRGFRPWQTGTPGWSAEPPLLEARLFWMHSALHVVAADAGGCRWCRIEESEHGDTPVLREQFPVVGRRDLARFGLDEADEVPELRAVVYTNGGRMLGWRLINLSSGVGRD